MMSWLKKFTLALLAPALLLALVEAALRLTGSGHPTSFLVESVVEGEPVWIDNPFFTYSFFDPALARLPPPILVRKDKPNNVVRIAVLGESAAQGDPLPDFGPPRVLEYILRHTQPDLHIEVINAAITAINSHVIKDIARELHKLQPDYVILYIGNNEVIGPFGPGTVFASYLKHDWMLRWVSGLNRLRLTQLLRHVQYLLADKRDPASFRGVAMFMEHPVAHDDPRLDTVRRRYRANLLSVVNSARDAGADVLISTVAANAEDCPPSISMLRTDLTGPDRAAWRAAYESALVDIRNQNWTAAQAHFMQAHAIDAQHAELNYWMGLCLQRLGQHAAARPWFELAREYDAFRYRADQALNDVLRELAAQGRDGVYLVDDESRLAVDSGRTDAELFVDHVHFSFEGTVALANLWAQALYASSDRFHGVAPASAPGAETLRDVLMFTQVAEISVLQEMARRYSRPPFEQHLDAARRVRELGDQITSLNQALREHIDDRVPDALRRRMEQYPDDAYFPAHLAQYLIAFNRFGEARSVVEPEVQRTPHRRGPRTTLAMLLALDGQSGQAAAVLLGTHRRHGFFGVTGATYVSSVLTSLGYYAEAAAALDAMAARAGPMDYRWRLREEADKAALLRDRFNEARHAVYAGRWSHAEQSLQAILAERPDLGEALFLMAVVQGKKGQPAIAAQMARQALTGMNFARAYYHGGLWQAKAGNMEAANELLTLCARHVYDDLILANSLAWVRAADRREGVRNVPEARAILERALRARDDQVPAYLLDTWAAVHAAEGDYEGAASWADQAIQKAEQEGDEELGREIAQRRAGYHDRSAVYWGRVNRPLNYF